MAKNSLGNPVAESSRSTIIRPATAHDVPGLVALSEIWHQDCEMHLQFDPVRSARLISHLVAADEGIALVGEDRGRLVGMLIGVALERWFSAERVAQALAFVVCPDYRGSNAADQLLVEFQAQGIKRGANVVELGTLAGQGFAAAKVALDRAAFHPVGTTWAWSPADHLIDAPTAGRH